MISILKLFKIKLISFVTITILWTIYANIKNEQLNHLINTKNA